jgi:hypothetical protein
MFKNLVINPVIDLIKIMKRSLKNTNYVVKNIDTEEAETTLYNSNYDVNRQHFIMRENLYENFKSSTFIYFFKTEWKFLFNNSNSLYEF